MQLNQRKRDPLSLKSTTYTLETHTRANSHRIVVGFSLVQLFGSKRSRFYSHNSLLGLFLEQFWEPFWDQIGPRRGEDGPKRATKSFKHPKSCICKNLKNNMFFFKIFGVQRPPKRGSRGPRRLPRGTQRAPKPEKNRIQKWTPKLLIF